MSSYLEILKYLQESSTDICLTPNQSHTLDIDKYQQNTVQHISNYHSKSYSFIEYIPFKRKLIEVQQKVYRQIIPKVKKESYQILKVLVESVPIEKVKTEYYAIQHIRHYQKQFVPERSIQYVPVVRTIKKLQYVPVERKIIHYPKDILQDFVEEELKKSSQMSPQYNSLSKEHQSKIVQTLFSPINEFHQEEGESQNYDYVNENLSSSILNSLSKAYTPQNSIDQGQKTSQSYLKSPKSPFQNVSYQPSTLQEANYKSAQTIDSRFFMNI